MPLRAEHLLAFAQTAELGSVSLAADALGLSQPAVSRQLASLQREVGRALYERTAHGVVLTAPGEALLPYAKAVAYTLAQAENFVHIQGENIVTLRVGLSHHLVTRLTAPLLRAERRFNETNAAALRLHMLEGYSEPLVADVRRGILDAALVLGVTKVESPLVIRQSGSDEMCLLVCPDDPLARAVLPLEAVRGETLLVSAPVSQVYKRMQAILAAAQVTPGRVLAVSGPAAVRSATLGGLGIGVTLRSFVQPDAEAGLLRCVALADGDPAMHVVVVTSNPEIVEAAKQQALDILLRVGLTDAFQ